MLICENVVFWRRNLDQALLSLSRFSTFSPALWAGKMPALLWLRLRPSCSEIIPNREFDGLRRRSWIDATADPKQSPRWHLRRRVDTAAFAGHRSDKPGICANSEPCTHITKYISFRKELPRSSRYPSPPSKDEVCRALVQNPKTSSIVRASSTLSDQASN